MTEAAEEMPEPWNRARSCSEKRIAERVSDASGIGLFGDIYLQETIVSTPTWKGFLKTNLGIYNTIGFHYFVAITKR